MLTKQAASDAYELGASLAIEDAGLNKTAADPGKIMQLLSKARGAATSPVGASAIGGGVLGGGGTLLGGGDVSDTLVGTALGAGAGAGLRHGVPAGIQSLAEKTQNKGIQNLAKRMRDAEIKRDRRLLKSLEQDIQRSYESTPLF